MITLTGVIVAVASEIQTVKMAIRIFLAARMARRATIRACARATHGQREISASVSVHAPMGATDGNHGVPLRTVGPFALNAKVGRRKIVARAIVEVQHGDVTVTRRV
jgi:hypothetical protein